MEGVLWLYSLPYDASLPVVCFDERPCFLIADEVEPISMQTGKVRKEHYTYEKNGSCALLCALEPLTGKRLAQVYEHRGKREYALFFKIAEDLAIAPKTVEVHRHNILHKLKMKNTAALINFINKSHLEFIE